MAKHSIKVSRQQLLVLVVLALALYAIVPQFGDFRSSWQRLSDPNPVWLGTALAFAALTYCFGALNYCLLAFKRLAYGQVLLVQLAAMFVNRLLPGGIGALGTNFVYLRGQKHSIAQASSVVAVNNMLGFVGHGLLIGTALLLFASQQTAQRQGDTGSLPLVVAATLLLGATLALVLGRRRFKKVLSDVVRQLATYRRRPKNIIAALLSSMMLTLANVACLACCALALDVHLSFVALFFVFSFGVGAGTVAPTPGGLGGFEAGMVAGMVAYGVDSSTALAVALLFRFITYWLALAVGAVAFVICQQRKLLAV